MHLIDTNNVLILLKNDLILHPQLYLDSPFHPLWSWGSLQGFFVLGILAFGSWWFLLKMLFVDFLGKRQAVEAFPLAVSHTLILSIHFPVTNSWQNDKILFSEGPQHGSEFSAVSDTRASPPSLHPHSWEDSSIRTRGGSCDV